MEMLEGRTAVVTGAASGIGLGMTEAFANRGMRVVMADVEEGPLNAEAERLTKANFQVSPRLADVSSADSMMALFQFATDTYGNVHVLCNNAGVAGGGGAIWESTDKDWNWVMGVNFQGVLHGLRLFVPHMLDHGEASHIVNTSSIAGMMTGGGSIYGVSKHAVSRLTEGLFFDLEARDANIGVTLLCPGIIDTKIIESGRNRPDHLKNDAAPAAPTEGAQRMTDYFSTQGMSPRRVGELVADGILAKRFYLFTQDEFMPRIKSRFDQIVAEQNPVLPGPLPTTLDNEAKKI